MFGFEQNITLGLQNVNTANQNQLSYALDRFNEALLQDNDNLFVLYLKRFCLIHLDRISEVEDCVAQMQKIDVNNIYSINALARLLLEKDKESLEAKRLFKQLTQIDDTKLDSFLAFKIKGDAYYSLGDPDTMLKYYELALKSQETPLLLDSIAFTYKGLEDYESAAMYFEKLKKYWPEEPMIYEELLTLYFYLKDYPKSFENYEELSKIDGVTFLPPYYSTICHTVLELHKQEHFNNSLELLKSIALGLNSYSLHKLYSQEYVYACCVLGRIHLQLWKDTEDQSYLDTAIGNFKTAKAEYNANAAFYDNNYPVFERKFCREVIDKLSHIKAKKTFAKKEEVSHAIKINSEMEEYNKKKLIINSDQKLKYYFNAFKTACTIMYVGSAAEKSERFKTDNDIPILQQLEGFAGLLPSPGESIVKMLNSAAKKFNEIRHTNQATNLMDILGDLLGAGQLIDRIALEITLFKQEEVIAYQDTSWEIFKLVKKVKKKVIKELYDNPQKVLGNADAIIFLGACKIGIINKDNIIKDSLQAIHDIKAFEQAANVSIKDKLLSHGQTKEAKEEKAAKDEHKKKWWKFGSKKKDADDNSQVDKVTKAFFVTKITYDNPELVQQAIDDAVTSKLATDLYNFMESNNLFNTWDQT